jgi:acylphosphatase
MKKRYHLHISGRVQGVCFRANTRKQARALGLTGWVRNLPDDRVETVFEGEQKEAEAMLAWCRRRLHRLRYRLLNHRPNQGLPTAGENP